MKPLDLVLSLLDVVERPAVAQLAGNDRKVGRREGPAQQLLRVFALIGQQQRDLRVRVIAGRKERQTVSVIPVQMTEDDRADERLAAEGLRQARQSCPCV